MYQRVTEHNKSIEEATNTTAEAVQAFRLFTTLWSKKFLDPADDKFHLPRYRCICNLPSKSSRFRKYET